MARRLPRSTLDACSIKCRCASALCLCLAGEEVVVGAKKCVESRDMMHGDVVFEGWGRCSEQLQCAQGTPTERCACFNSPHRIDSGGGNRPKQKRPGHANCHHHIPVAGLFLGQHLYLRNTLCRRKKGMMESWKSQPRKRREREYPEFRPVGGREPDPPLHRCRPRFSRQLDNMSTPQAISMFILYWASISEVRGKMGMTMQLHCCRAFTIATEIPKLHIAVGAMARPRHHHGASADMKGEN